MNKSGRRHQCYLCKNTFHHFIKFRGGLKAWPPFARDLQIIGSDTDNFWCPCCRCYDRERHLIMYFDKLGLWEDLKGKVLHIAPEV